MVVNKYYFVLYIEKLQFYQKKIFEINKSLKKRHD